MQNCEHNKFLRYTHPYGNIGYNDKCTDCGKVLNGMFIKDMLKYKYYTRHLFGDLYSFMVQLKDYTIPMKIYEKYNICKDDRKGMENLIYKLVFGKNYKIKYMSLNKCKSFGDHELVQVAVANENLSFVISNCCRCGFSKGSCLSDLINIDSKELLEVYKSKYLSHYDDLFLKSDIRSNLLYLQNSGIGKTVNCILNLFTVEEYEKKIHEKIIEHENFYKE